MRRVGPHLACQGRHSFYASLKLGSSVRPAAFEPMLISLRQLAGLKVEPVEAGSYAVLYLN